MHVDVRLCLGEVRLTGRLLGGDPGGVVLALGLDLAHLGYTNQRREGV